MPELPEVEIVKGGLNQLTLNQSIWGGEVLLSRTVASPFSSQDFLTGLETKAIAHWYRQGKYLLAQLAPNGYLGVHLRMTGQLLWVNSETPVHKHTRVRLFFPHHQELRFVDQRTFGQMWYVPPETKPEKIMTGLQKLGLDPFDQKFSAEYLAAKFKKSRRLIKNVLLDQSIIAGLGNIYADEALFLSKLHPQSLCNELTITQINQLKSAILQVLTASIEAGGTTFSNFLNVEGINGNYGGSAWVYNREGKNCKICSTIIQRMKLGGRSAHFCPNCQNLIYNQKTENNINH